MADLDVEVFVAPQIAAPLPAERIEAAVRAVLRAEGVAEAAFSVAFLDDTELARLNEQYLGHPGPTDVLSFALHGAGETPHGDIYVGAEQATRQAAEWGVAPADEWLRLAVHGTLHVLGYDHPDGADRLDSPMYRRQEQLLAELREERA